ncbi:MAG: acetyl-CoA carboxylase biotin carboxyl carrier protein subunit [Gammaproteobacteria bacterium]|nr:acetyl-CoA carboxylase biotin carboxyl carrier protein subunit [Gammaproteobacteria bacterium]
MARIEVVSEVAGTVWKVVAEVGAILAEGDPLVILESMKMEVPVEAPAAGRLVELRVEREDPVDEDQVIALLDTE